MRGVFRGDTLSALPEPKHPQIPKEGYAGIRAFGWVGFAAVPMRGVRFAVFPLVGGQEIPPAPPGTYELILRLLVVAKAVPLFFRKLQSRGRERLRARLPRR
jgi:hypothetical protein